MARKRINFTDKQGPFGRTYQVDSSGRKVNDEMRAHRAKVDRMIQEREALLNGMPEYMRNAPGAVEAADALIGAKYLPSNGTAQLIGGGLLGAGAIGAGLQAYSQQRNEYLPAGPFDVAGRMVSNLNPFQGQPVGVDPLAEARNNVAAAGELVGSTNVLDAMAQDEMAAMESRQSIVNNGGMGADDLMALQGVNQMIDARAQELMATPWIDATGNRRHFTHNEAQRLATEQVNMQLRASDVY